MGKNCPVTRFDFFLLVFGIPFAIGGVLATILYLFMGILTLHHLMNNDLIAQRFLNEFLTAVVITFLGGAMLWWFTIREQRR